MTDGRPVRDGCYQQRSQIADVTRLGQGLITYGARIMGRKVPRQSAHRNSVNGRFVTERYADRNPKTTEHEQIKRADWKR